jgi:hypothetical protein
MSRVIVPQVPGSKPAAFLVVGRPVRPRLRVSWSPRSAAIRVPGAGNRDLLEELR